jgi:large subunit ribosomal protein LX
MTAKAEKISINVFKVSGSYKKGKRSQKFFKEILIENKDNAKEYILSVIGSKHRVKRREIKISNIEKISKDQVTDPIIKQMIGGK